MGASLVAKGALTLTALAFWQWGCQSRLPRHQPHGKTGVAASWAQQDGMAYIESGSHVAVRPTLSA